MKRIVLLGIWTLLTVVVNAQTAAEQKAIKNLCGCFEIEFKYAETFAKDSSYALSKPYHATGLEWVVAEETSNKKFVLQHLLVVQDSMVIKHWREDWEYEKAEQWSFEKNATWKKFQQKPELVKGTWTQTVWEVDDAPRYQGSSKWISNDGKFYWENTADAPLPRREYTKRSDYNVLERGNRIVVTDKAWTHEQDNRKVKRDDGQPDLVVAEEKGYNIYTKTDDAKCKAASEWWAKHHGFWNNVRKEWDVVLSAKQRVKLLPTVNSRNLDRTLGSVERSGLAAQEEKEAIRKVLVQFAQ